MTDFNIQYGRSTEIFIDGQLNPNLIIEEGCWYLCIDTAELFIGINTEDGLTLKRINEARINQIPVEDIALKSDLESVKQEVIQTVVPEVEEVKTKVEIDLAPAVEEVKTAAEELKTWVENKDYLQDIDLEGYATDLEVENLLAGKSAEVLSEVQRDVTDKAAVVLAEAQAYARTVASEKADIVKNALLDGAGEAFDTLRELGTLIKTSESAIQALEQIATNKANKEHTHAEYLTTIPDEYVTESELQNKGYLTSVPKEYITETELDSKGYLTEHQSLAGLATEAWVESKNYLTTHQSLDSYATKEDLADAIDSIEHPTVDLTGYVTKTDLDGFIKEIPAEYVTDSELEAKGYLTEHQDLSEYAKKNDIPSVPTKVSELVNDKNYLTAVPSEYITETELNAKNYLTEHQSLAGLATEQFVNTAINGISIPKVPNNVSAFANDAGYITKADIPETDLSGLATVAQLATKADDIPFIEDQFVTKSFGGFAIGDSLKGMTIATILAKLFELSDSVPTEPDVPTEPEGVVDTIITNQQPLFTMDAKGELVEIPYKYIELTEETAAHAPVETGFYQIKDADGTVIESGYQDLQVDNGDVYYMVALPKGIDYTTMVNVQVYDNLRNIWTATSLPMTSDPAIIEERCAETNLDISHIDTSVYTIWVADDVPTGSKLRFVINE